MRRALFIAAAIVAAASTVSAWWLVIGGAVLYAVAEIVVPRPRQPRRMADANQTSASLLISIAATTALIREGASDTLVWEITIALAIIHAVSLLRLVLRILVARRWRTAITWRNLELGQPQVRRAESGGRFLQPVPIWLAAPVCVALSAPPLVFPTIAVVVGLWSLLALVPIGRIVVHNRRLPSEASRVRALLEATRELGPEILVHFNGPISSAHALAEWVGVLERLHESHPVVIIVIDRQPWHLDLVPTDVLPVVHLQGAEAIEYFVDEVPTLVTAMYPRSTEANKNLLRVPGLYDVLLGHGESDRVSQTNPSARAFDEIWVAGAAARDRYLAAGIGVREQQLRLVGRPQLQALENALGMGGAAGPTTVLYAPTSDGDFAPDGASSLLDLGARIVAALLEDESLTVVFAPHPALASADRRYADAAARIENLIDRAGGHHRTVTVPEDRYREFAGASLLITDVSSDLVDFLVVDRPYLVTNPADEAIETFLDRNPSARGGVVIGPADIPALARTVADAVSADGRSDDRRALAGYYLGDLSTPPIERFLAQVDESLALARTTRPRALPEAVSS